MNIGTLLYSLKIDDEIKREENEKNPKHKKILKVALLDDFDKLELPARCYKNPRSPFIYCYISDLFSDEIH